MQQSPQAPRRRSLAALAIAGALAAGALSGIRPAQAAQADEGAARNYPDRPITLLVGFPAGGPSDSAARIMVDRLQSAWPGARIIVENRGGANGTLAAAALLKAPADGYTLFFVTRSHVNLKWLYKSGLPFDTETDFLPVAEVLDMPNVLVVGPSVKEKSYAELARDIAAKPDTFTAFSSGNGSDPHLALALFEERTGLKIRHIPYKGGNQGMLDMLSGRVDLSFATLGTVMQQIRQGKLRALAIGGKQRDPLLPDVPTFAEVGVRDYSPETWYGVMAAKGTPPAIVEKLNRTINQVMNTPEGKAKLETLGAEPVNASVSEFDATYRKDMQEARELIQKLNVSID
jgi:tripartite-type tricarboxylate transporter receptor subunit TctC